MREMLCFLFLLFCCLWVVPAHGQDKVFNTKGWPDSLWVSPDGNVALFMYSRYNFFPAILGQGKPVKEGPLRNGHHVNDTNPWDDSDLYIVSRDKKGDWGRAMNMPTNDDKADCCGMISGDELFFQKGQDLYISQYKDETWTKPQFLPVNSKSVDTNPHHDYASDTLYWASNRDGNFDLWFSKRTRNADGRTQWSAPQKLPGEINTKAKEDQPFVMGNIIRFSREGQAGNVMAKKTQQGWTMGETEHLGTDLYHSEISISSDGNTAWFVTGDLSTQRMVFMSARRGKDGSWLTVKPMD